MVMLSEDKSPMEDVDVGEVDNNFIPGQVHSQSPTVKEASSGQQSKQAWVEEVDDDDIHEFEDTHRNILIVLWIPWVQKRPNLGKSEMSRIWMRWSHMSCLWRKRSGSW